MNLVKIVKQEEFIAASELENAKLFKTGPRNVFEFPVVQVCNGDGVHLLYVTKEDAEKSLEYILNK